MTTGGFFVRCLGRGQTDAEKSVDLRFQADIH